MSDEEWRLQAACRTADPALFFPERAEEAGPAKAICRSCPVQRTCLDYALAIPDLDGIWGGKSSSQRARMRHGATAERGTANATKTHCAQGHEYTPENTRISNYKGSRQRVCKTCAADAQRRHRERRRARTA